MQKWKNVFYILSRTLCFVSCYLPALHVCCFKQEIWFATLFCASAGPLGSFSALSRASLILLAASTSPEYRRPLRKQKIVIQILSEVSKLWKKGVHWKTALKQSCCVCSKPWDVMEVSVFVFLHPLQFPLLSHWGLVLNVPQRTAPLAAALLEKHQKRRKPLNDAMTGSC